MRAFRIVEWRRPPALVDVPVPEPGPGQVLVRVAGCGLCHSDLTMMDLPREVGEAIGWRAPFTLGHETAGRVAALGAGATGVAPGDAVALVSPSSCGGCWYCVRGLDSSCPDGLAGRGYGRDGGLAEYVLAGGVRDLVPLRTLDPRTAGPLTDAGATAYHAVRRALPRVVPGGLAVVIGAGGLGTFAVQFLRALTSARVVAVDADPARLGLARELGAHEALAGATGATPGEIKALSDGGRGADAVLDFVGADGTIRAGLASLRPGGAYGLVGASGGTFPGPWFGGLPRDGEVFTFQGSTIADVQEVVALAERGAIRNEVEVFPLERVEEAYARLGEGGLRGRVVVVPDG
ncbi:MULTISPECIES: alcohol dehydrogenase catalytic domain-containing protein [Actinomadura]|uniref:alcohol dehydrogenase n=1 Tax=Actinomadura yumaensis TaxID=111807 RepID=A0ABW2CJ98_9ACTN|nr:alcohol dehydrogenase catalytic domain-containing protein [Actinomadura sp. J1-007]MWK33160.1 alcohol dehydrogenase catalytic domain-containing protein [Actinomadura sp. J1-007]